MSALQKVLIVGGGIGGLSTAIALRKEGIEVDVLELNKEWTVYHVGIIVQGNFIRALKDLGVVDKAIETGFPYEKVEFRDPQTNEKVAEMDAGEPIAGSDYPTELGLSRPALHDVLRDTALESGINMHLGLSYEKLDQQEDKVIATFTNGEIHEYDLVVAADGAYSKTREMLFGDQHKPRFTGQGVWRYNFPRPESHTHSVMYESISNGRKPGFIPLTQDSMYMFLTSEEPGNPRHPRDQMHTLLQERMEGFGGLVEEMKPLVVDPNLVVYRPLEVSLLTDPWYKGRILLIGDAAHTTTPHFGQGAGLAVEDAVVLGTLAGQDISVPQLLKRFMENRYERVKFIVEGSIQIGEWEMNPTPDANPLALYNKMRRIIAEPLVK